MTDHYFGVVSDAWAISDWQAAVGVKPDLIALFEHWYKQRTLDTQFAKARSLGINRMMITWEPWEPVPVGTSFSNQGVSQPQWSNEAIARGDHDDYIGRFAVSVRDSGMSTVYIRLMHEMNGYWYPWRIDPDAYVAAWKRIHLVFAKKEAKANVEWVWAPNPNPYQDAPGWLKSVLPYWPGKDYVDFLGMTVINFGGDRDYAVDEFAQRFSLAGTVFKRAMLVPEFQSAFEYRDQWMRDFADWLQRKDLYVAVLSQGTSRAAAAMDTGTLDWSVMYDDAGKARVRDIIEAQHSH